MAVLFDSGIFSVVSATGAPLPGALLYWYATGTLTPLATYSDDELTVPNANPVVADANGRFPAIWLQDAEYKMILKTAAGVTVRTRDPISGKDPLVALATSAGAGLSGASQDETYAQGTLGDHYKRFVCATDAPFNAKLDGTTDDTTAINAAITFVATNGGGTVWIPSGRAKITAPIGGAYSNVQIVGAGPGGTVLLPYGWTDAVRFANGYPSPIGILTNVGVSNLTIDCTNQTAGANDQNGNGVNFNACENFSCQNVEILKVKQQGIAEVYWSVAGSVPQGGDIRDNYVDLTLSTNIAIGVEGNAMRTIVSGNRIKMLTGYGIYGGNIGGSGASGNLVIAGNIISAESANTGNAIKVEDGIKKAVITGNNIDGVAIGIRCGVSGTNHSFNYTVVANTVNEYNDIGIVIGPVVSGDTSQALVSGNTVTSTAPAGADNAAITVLGGAFVTGNMLQFGTGVQGVKVTGADNVIRANSIMGTSGYAVEASLSTGSVIADNTSNQDVLPAADTKTFGNIRLGSAVDRWNTLAMGGARFVPNPNGASAPVAGTWATNDIVWNSGFAPTGYIGYCCTAGGTPGTWKGFGVIQA